MFAPDVNQLKKAEIHSDRSATMCNCIAYDNRLYVIIYNRHLYAFSSGTWNWPVFVYCIQRQTIFPNSLLKYKRHWNIRISFYMFIKITYHSGWAAANLKRKTIVEGIIENSIKVMYRNFILIGINWHSVNNYNTCEHCTETWFSWSEVIRIP